MCKIELYRHHTYIIIFERPHICISSLIKILKLPCQPIIFSATGIISLIETRRGRYKENRSHARPARCQRLRPASCPTGPSRSWLGRWCSSTSSVAPHATRTRGCDCPRRCSGRGSRRRRHAKPARCPILLPFGPPSCSVRRNAALIYIGNVTHRIIAR